MNLDKIAPYSALGAAFFFFIGSLLLFYFETGLLLKSLFASFLTFGLVWLSVTVIGWLIQGIRNK